MRISLFLHKGAVRAALDRRSRLWTNRHEAGAAAA
jgi:hypothetical protein